MGAWSQQKLDYSPLAIRALFPKPHDASPWLQCLLRQPDYQQKNPWPFASDYPVCTRYIPSMVCFHPFVSGHHQHRKRYQQLPNSSSRKGNCCLVLQSQRCVPNRLQAGGYPIVWIHRLFLKSFSKSNWWTSGTKVISGNRIQGKRGGDCGWGGNFAIGNVHFFHSVDGVASGFTETLWADVYCIATTSKRKWTIDV